MCECPSRCCGANPDGKAGPKSAVCQTFASPAGGGPAAIPTDREAAGLGILPPRPGMTRPFLNTGQAAHYLGIGWRKLMRLRVAGQGPCFRKHGRLIVYHVDDIDAWSRETTGGTHHGR